MMLTDPTVIRDQLGFDDMVDVNDAIMGALHAATEVLSSRIGTQMEDFTGYDTFFVESPSWDSGISVRTEFKLSRGFVRSIASVKYQNDLTLLGGSEAITLDNLISDLFKGKVTEMGTAFNNQFVRITYTSGFQADTVFTEMYQSAQVPSWLKEAAKTQAIILLSNHAVMEQAGVTVDVKTLGRQLDAIVAHRIRYVPTALDPI